MRVVIDTNCFLAILPKNSRYRPIFDAYRSAKFKLSVSTEILNEYEEVFSRKMNSEIAENIIQLILKQVNTIETEIYYRWGLIIADYDDNKFVDTAISCNADFLITSDKHFNSLNSIPFPQINVISIDEFLKIVNSL